MSTDYKLNRLAGSSPAAGFTLIELMIVVAIIGILAAIAYPSYQNSVQNSRRADAQSALTAFSNAMERHYTNNNNSYEGAAGTAATPEDLGAPRIFPTEAPLDGATKFYDLTISAVTRNAYTIQATAKGAQAGNGDLRLLSNGTRQWQKDGINWVSWNE